MSVRKKIAVFLMVLYGSFPIFLITVAQLPMIKITLRQYGTHIQLLFLQGYYTCI